MGKLEYLDALKRAMLGLPPDVQAKTLAYYEQRFVDGIAFDRRVDDGLALQPAHANGVALRGAQRFDTCTAFGIARRLDRGDVTQCTTRFQRLGDEQIGMRLQKAARAELKNRITHYR